jgi:hypothetical protein
MASTQGGITSSDETFWVLGGGHVGRRAVELLRKNAPFCNIVVVDSSQIRDLPVSIECVCADGVEWFAEHFTPEARVDKIIPALPLHLAADWVRKKLADEHRYVSSLDIPDELLQHLPNPIRLNPSRIVTSHADFLCPLDCPEPDSICTYTRMQRPQLLYHLLEKIHFGSFRTFILRSRQFAMGVGGFYPKDLWRFLERVRSLPGTPLLIGTACKCHGIVDAICHTVP